MSTKPPTHDLCRCGIFRYVHEVHPERLRGCQRFRKMSRIGVWRHHHSARHHVAAWLWLKVPSKTRWDIVSKVHDLIPDLCWCDLVDAALTERERVGCLCDTHLPIAHRMKPEDFGRCYCAPAPQIRAEAS